MQEKSAYELYLNIKLVRIFSSGAYLGEVEIEKSPITLKYATDAERLLDTLGNTITLNDPRANIILQYK